MKMKALLHVVDKGEQLENVNNIVRAPRTLELLALVSLHRHNPIAPGEPCSVSEGFWQIEIGKR